MQELIQKLKEHQRETLRIEVERFNQEQAIVLELVATGCPLVAGDVVDTPHPVWNTSRGVVIEVVPVRHRFAQDQRCDVRVAMLKKDGTPGKNIYDFPYFYGSSSGNPVKVG